MSELETRLERHILRQLLLRWRRINDECLGGRLTPPVFVLDEARQRLGRWEGNTRTLGISRDHIRSSNWLQIEQTLRHEMAHQAVSELFDASAAKPHGILFRRACRMLEVAPGEVGTSAYDPNTNRVLRRIQKLMQLATSANENEAQSAMNTANSTLCGCPIISSMRTCFLDRAIVVLTQMHWTKKWSLRIRPINLRSRLIRALALPIQR